MVTGMILAMANLNDLLLISKDMQYLSSSWRRLCGNDASFPGFWSDQNAQ